ncbi:hypothetical protein Micbo1qcDRAFT_210459 [Microdochium bolleyi]|uniref:Uncharacterized protein n=1 Tax=Microdochium bolleyi TaxID=196109 RepID=A0A136IJD1_9PEZI|nr:hypothetical protein Micbo1qcDRAFT_210459 [Microdochium bolleyi]
MSGLPDATFIEAPFAGLAILSLLGIGVASLALFCKSRDPARRGFWWLGPASLTLGIFAILDLAMVLWFRLAIPSFETVTRLIQVSALFYHNAYIQVFIVLVELAVGLHGIVVVADNATTTTTNKFRKVARGCMFATASIVSALIVTEFIAGLAVTPLVPGPRNDQNIRQALPKVRVTAHMILLAASIAALGLAVYVFRLARKSHFAGNEICQYLTSMRMTRKQVHKLLLAAVILFLFHALFYLATDISALVPYRVIGSGFTVFQSQMEYEHRQYGVFVLAVVGNSFLTPIAVVLLFVAGRRQAGGLWSSQQGGAGTEVGVGDVGKGEREHNPSV